jgi:hypothetical protein
LSKIMISGLCGVMCVVVVVVLSGCGGDSEGNGNNITLLAPADLLPDDNDISGWESVGVYDEANDYDALYDLIDGGAELFIDNGFVSAAFQIYTNCTGGACTDVPVRVRIYDQGTEANAVAVYDRVATGIGIPWDGAGVEARIDESALAVYTIEFWQRNMFVQVLIEEKSDDALNIAKLFASHISKKIG